MVTKNGKYRFSVEDRTKAVKDVIRLMEEDGLTQNKACESIADELGLSSPRTLAMWAADLAMKLPSTPSNKERGQRAAASHVIYNQLARADLSDKLFQRVADLLPITTEPADLQKLAVAYAVLVEKRRLEEGKSTTNNRIDAPGSRADEPGTLEELATGKQLALPSNVSPLERRSFTPTDTSVNVP